MLSSAAFLKVSTISKPFFRQNKLHFACWLRSLSVCQAHPAPRQYFCKTTPSLHSDLPKPLPGSPSVKHTQLKPGNSAAALIELLAPGNALNLWILHLSRRNTELQPSGALRRGTRLSRDVPREGAGEGAARQRGHICWLSWIQSLPVSCICYLPFPGCK